MNQPAKIAPQPTPDIHALERALRSTTTGDIRFDDLSRTLYATDASIYRITPTGVVLPRSRDDIIATVSACRTHNVPIIPRGAGTGLTGGAIGHGIALDCSRHMHAITNLNIEARTVRVQPGVILDQLNAQLAPHNLHFAPDISTSSRATIGGMIANNACGTHSVIYGRTVDHIKSLTVILADASVATWPTETPTDNHRVAAIQSELVQIAETYRDEVNERYPKVLRRNGGYLLDRICNTSPIGNTSTPLNPAEIICGSEGTLCVIEEAVLNLTPLPRFKGQLLIHFDDLLDALAATPHILNHAPSAIELIDRLILRAALRDPTVRDTCKFLNPSVDAILVVEFFADSEKELAGKLEKLATKLKSQHIGTDLRTILNSDQQSAVWEMRKRGLGLLMSQPGDDQTHAFVEDSAVDPTHLRDYIAEFRKILTDEGVPDASFYAHASVGVIHVRPILNLKTDHGLQQMRRIADRVSTLALKYGGAMTGEHGDGLVRSEWLEKMYGPKIINAFREVKHAFDPEGLFNPGKIVDPLPMTENLRFGPDYKTRHPGTHLDFSRHGGISGLAEMCNGLAQCRQKPTQHADAGNMCPSFMATGDEQHTTRARANALREALSNRGRLNGFDDPRLDDVFDLCNMCKACKSECPAGVDVAKLKSEWLAHKNLNSGAPPSARFIADAPKLARTASRFPRLANLLLRSAPARAYLERHYDLDRRIPPPKFAHRTFRHWLKKHRKRRSTDSEFMNRPPVLYLPDTWTNFYTPQVGIATIKLIEAAGYRTICPTLTCCGRPLISKGFLAEAAENAKFNIEKLTPFAERGLPILSSEPSCLSTYLDEYPQFVKTQAAKIVARQIQSVETFLATCCRKDPERLKFRDISRAITLHPHCHQVTHTGITDTVQMLKTPPGYTLTTLTSGCCGMAGAFGHEKSHYDIAQKMGEHRLLPALRNAPETDIAVTGFSCREQISHHLGATPRHVLEWLADAL